MNCDIPAFNPESIFHINAEFDLDRLKGLISDYSAGMMYSFPPLLPLGLNESTLDQAESPAPSLSNIIHAIVPHDPPLSSDFRESKFYIRACYEVYYDLIVACLSSSERDLLTVFGTPGTGKSLFYVYVFNRYRHENPMATIVVATFSNDRKMTECWVYEPGRDRQEVDKIPNIPGAIHLYDGPASLLPRRGKMVCFSCPNVAWLRSNKKHPRHRCLRFPVWTLDELLDANEVCDLKLEEDTIRDRFNFFGGSARYCLSTSDDFVSSGRDEIERKIVEIDTLDKLNACLEASAGGGQTSQERFSHQIFHWTPRFDKLFPFVYLSGHQFLCSRIVDAMIRDRIARKTVATHQDFVLMISACPTLSQVRGVMFENYAHFRFSKGGSYTLGAMCENYKDISLNWSVGAYQEMQPGCESVDGVAVIADVVYLFQMTVSDSHPVNAHGILEQMKRLGRFDRFIHGTQKVCLVFVRPHSNSRTNFKRQPINMVEYVDEGCSINKMKKMRKTWSAELARLNVQSIKELIQYAEKTDKYSGIVSDYLARNTNAGFNDLVCAIPQYEMKLSEFDKGTEPEDVNEQVRSLKAEIEELRRLLNQTMAGA